MAKSHEKAISIIVSLLIVIGTAALSTFWLTNQPRAARKPTDRIIPLVETINPQVIDFQTTVSALGNVIPAQSVDLTPRVEGIVVSVSDSFIEGGLLKRNEEIVRLDPTDYELRLRQAESDLTRAQFNLKLELGQQAIAKREFEMLGNNLDELATELIQRKPHLEASKAALKAAESVLEQARLNLERTRTLAPFDAVVVERNANIGSRVTASANGTPLVRLVSTESFWIDVALPIDKLRWIDIPGINGLEGAPVKVTFENAWGPDAFRIGVVKRLKAEVEPEGRMAKVLVEVDDPMALKPANKNLPSLMLGSLVRVEIAGKVLKDVVELPETLVHEGRYLWLMNDEQILNITDVKPFWKEQGRVFLEKDQLPPDNRIVASNLPAPVQGMRIRTHETDASNLIK